MLQVGRTAAIVIEISILSLFIFVPLVAFGAPESAIVTLDQPIYLLGALVFIVPHSAAIVGAIALRVGRSYQSFRSFGIVPPTWGDVARAVPLLVVITVVGWGGNWLAPALPNAVQWQVESRANLPLLLLLALLIGYHEELFFRAYLLTRLGHLAVAAPLRVVVSASLFAVAHINQGAVAVAVALVSGVLLALAFERYSSLHMVAWAHGLYNFATIVIVAVI